MTGPPHAIYMRDHNKTRHALLHAAHPSPPTPSATDLLVRVHAVSVSHFDLPALHPPPPALPFVAGRQAAGTVIHVGPDVSAFQPGDRVALLAPAAWADTVAVDARCAVKLPDHVPWGEAAALLGALVVAIDAVQMAALSDAETVIVTGAASAVGAAIVQVAKAVANASVIAVVSGPADAAIAQKLGAALVVDRSQRTLSSALGSRRVRVAFDAAGVAHRLTRMVRRGGCIMQAGEHAPQAALHGARRQARLREACRRRRVRAAAVPLHATHARVKEAARFLPHVRVPHGPSFGVKEYSRAMAVAEEGVPAGKVVILF